MGEVYACFTDSRGQNYELIEGYRDRIKPDWRNMFTPPVQAFSADYLATVAGAQPILKPMFADFDRKKQRFDLRFFHHNLNRMTLRDLGYISKAAGFETLAIIAWPNVADVSQLSCETLAQVQANYPSVTLNDLLARRVWVLLKKPE